jgi:hypothetical protein
MRKLSFLIWITLLITSGEISLGQNYIGMHKDQIIETMKETNKRLKLNTEVINPHYNYLKFENRIDEITFLFFLSDKDICTSVRETYAYSNINDVIESLNKKYTKEAENKWFFLDKNGMHKVELVEKEWYFVVYTRLDE